MKKKIFSTLLLVAFALASTSMFVSCKDYDDDINANKDRIAALETTVNGLKASIANLEACCQTVQGQIATMSGDIEGLKTKYAELAAKLQGLDDRIAALEAAQTVLENALAGKASQEDLDALATRVAAIETSLADALVNGGVASINYVDAATANLQAQIDVLNKYREALLEYLGLTDDDAAIEKVKNLVESLKAAVQKIGSFPADDLTADEVANLRKLLGTESGEIDKVITEANILQFLLNKQLTGLVAKGMNMIGGVEHIEVPALYYQPVIAKVGEGVNEEYHYIDPATDAVFDGDVFDGTSPYLFDSGAMHPMPVLDGVHSWADFVAKYGEGSTGAVDRFFTNLLREYENVKIARDISYGTFKALANPSSVNLDNVKFNFYTDTRLWGEEVESRNGIDGFAVPVSEKVDGKNTTYKDGEINVNFTIPAWEAYVHQIARTADGNYVKNPFAATDPAEFASLHDSLNWVSLQAQVGEVDNETARVSSDFVVVTPSLVHIQALADNEPEAAILNCGHKSGTWTSAPRDWFGKNGLGGHMWKTARTAIAKPATHSVAYNRTLDIMPFIETHYSNFGFFMTWSSYDMMMSPEMFKQLGLRYEFTLVDYEDGIHMTGESKHLTMQVNRDENADFGIASVIVTPRSVTAAGETIADKVATREAIDREPLVRIEVVDEKKQVLEVGYMKLIITDNLEPTYCEVTIPYDYYMNCSDEAGVTWSQVENLILAKIGELGYTKEQFEAEYELETYSGVPGTEAVQYYFLPSETSFKEPAENPKKYYKAALADTLGKVKYTYMVPTKYDTQAKQTNVLMWALSEKVADVARYITGKATAEEARLALLENKGTGFKENGLITTVRFIKKGVAPKYQEMTAIYVDLIIPGDQVHFAYGEVKNKDLSHWYELNSSAKDVASEESGSAFEVHENVPTPAEEGDDLLEETDFQRSLLENFKKGIVSLDMPNPEKFTKYPAAVSFRFILPKKDVNAEFDATVDEATYGPNNGTWTVPAYSKFHGGQSEYTLHLDEPFVEANGEISYKAIYDEYNVPIVRIVGNRIEYQYNDDSDDILNWTGRYDNDGKNIYAEYMKSLMTFTSYIEIYTQDGPVCYNMLIKNALFNAKFVRPINPWAANHTWTDALNKKETLNVSDLLTIKDWRDYSIDLKNKVKYDDAKKLIGFGFYNICELFAPYDEIRTDHAAEPSLRTEISSKLATDKYIAQEAIIKYVEDGKLDLASDIPALTNTYLQSKESVVNALKQSVITYTNNGCIVQKFHLFVPIYIKYNWGEYDNTWTTDGVNKAWTFNPSTFKVWAIISVDATTGNEN